MMTRLIVLFLLTLGSISAYGQLDTIHYLPPLFGRTNIDQHYISISTLSPNNVLVQVTKGDGSLIQNVTITSVSPSLILLGSGTAANGIIGISDLNSISTDEGIIVKSSAPTFVNIRHVQNAQGLCLTSKGRFALGTEFRSGHLFTNQSMSSVKAHEISVMATMNNTVVNFSDFSSNVIFKNTLTSGGTSNQISVTLNEGESYVIAAYVDEPGASGNRNDVNGTKITATKPIAVNSGSWLSGANGNGRDIGVDQITPLDIIGTEYIFTEGNGGPNNERPCVVAEYNNTQIFINGGLTPVATINSGDYYFILNSAFAANGNLYVRTSEPSYLYQSLSGASHASNGLNFIPPIRCSGNSEVIIPNVNLVGTASVAITARTGANVYINGGTIPIGGAMVVTGNPSWVTYNVPGGTGNFRVTSDSIINVALLTLNGVRGSAGYFSGFGELQEIERGDTLDFIICQDSKSSFLKLNISGPYGAITPSFKDPSLGGGISIDTVSGDTVYYTYTNTSSLALIDTVELEICKILNCSGTLIDTFCTTSTLIFDKYAAINAGIGDSLVICQDTTSISLFNILTGSPPNTGTWIDEDQSGFLFNGILQPNLALPGIYRYTYIVNGPLSCYDSSIVIINVLPINSAYCCPINPVFSIQNINCQGNSTGAIQINDANATQFSIDGGSSFQTTGNFSNLLAGIYNIRLEFGPDCNFDTVINLLQPNPLTANFQTDTVLCFNDCNGEIAIAPLGGTSPYSYQINGSTAQVNPLFTGLCASNYLISINDANNCTFNQNISVIERQILSLLLDSIVDETCTASNGIISLSAQGGSPNYQYSIDGGPFQMASIFNGLAAGSYTLTVKDVNDCTDQISVSLNDQSGPIPYIDTLFNIPCFSGSNGEVLIGVNNGAPGFQYALNNGVLQTSNIFNTISAGNHSITVTDDNGCTGLVNFTLTEPSQLSFNVSHQDALCFDDCSGKIFLDVSGSNPPYNYSINGLFYSQIPFMQFDTIVNVCSGNNINIIVKDSLDCLSNGFISIAEPDSIEIMSTLLDPSCFYNCDGSISIQTIGGTGTFEYSIDNGLTYQLSNQFLNLCGDMYTLKVKDANQCVNTDTSFLIAPPEFKIDTLSIVHTTCGASGGSIQVEIDSPINPNYTFNNINTGTTIVNASTATFPGLTAGAYGITAVDNSGCIDTMYVGVNDNSLTINLTPISITHVDCYGLCTGSFTVAANGGNAPYLFSINNGVTGNSPTFGGLCAEEYLVLVQDAAGCIETIQLEITQPEEMNFSTSVLDVDCFGTCTGEINFTNNSGGTLPYNFSVDNGVSYFSDSTFTNQCAGQYDIVLRDINNCQITSSLQVSENTELTAIHTTYDLSCNNSNDGIILFLASAGTPSYQYSIDDGATFSSNSSHVGLSAGNYFIEIMDDLNCTFYDTIDILEPVQNGVNISKVENLCSYSCDGELTLNASGGTLPYLYSIDNGTTFLMTNTFNNLCSGQYQVRVVDDNNCQINILDSLLFIDTLTFNTVAVNSDCNFPTGSINITAIGGVPNYEYSIDQVNYNTVSLISNLGSALYDIYVKDNNNCLATNQVTINNFLSPQIDSIQKSLPCHGECNGALTVFASGGNGVYEFSIDGITFQNSSQFLTVCGGDYTIIVRDGNGCSNIINYTLTEPDTISFTSIVNPILCFGNQNGFIDLSAQGGVGQLVYSFNGALATSLASYPQLGAGSYTVNISDEIGCSVQFDTTLTQPNAIQIAFNTISPSCFGICDGSIEAVITGGIPNNGIYDYSWSQFSSNNSLQNNVCSGLYSISVQDSNGCIADSINFELTEPIFATFDSLSILGVDCFGSTTGSGVTAFAPPGSQFSFDNGQTYSLSNQMNNIPTGSYWIFIQDANNCPGDSIETYVPTPQVLSGFVGPDMVICFGDLVNFSAIPVGGTGPYLYNWNNGYSNQVSFSENVSVNTTYFVEITDANGCSYTTDNQEVTLTLPPVITKSNDTIVCANESVYLWAVPDNQVDNYTFNWSVGGVGLEHFITPTIISDTVFYISIIDECNLTNSDSIHVNVFTQPIIEFQIDTVYGCVPHIQAYNATITQNEIYGNIDWVNTIGSIKSSGNEGLVIMYDYIGTDYLQANYTSTDGCNYQVDFETYIEINPTPTANFSFLPDNPNNYDELISFKNESIEYIYSNWSISGQTFDSENVDLPVELIDNIYKPLRTCLEVSNDKKCADEVCKNITIEVDQLIFVPNSFTPGNNGGNTIFKADGTNVDVYGFHMIIFNRWGEIVFESYDIDYGWDGTYANRFVSTGVYTWKIDVALKSDPSTVNNLIGQVTLLR